ncbi:glycosyl transferase [Microbacterium sp. LWH12-1.2]|uniref:glycosyl transferase n=1 Tax=Microbacterium sp. LWH12-1.2 TaxID=3135259 RepID=UPI0034252EBF
MRFVWAVVAFVLATVLIGAGIAQRTIFMGPSSQQMQVKIDEPAPFVLMDGDVLRARPGAQTLLIRGEGDIFAAYGRTADLKAWLADSDYNQVSLNDAGRPTVKAVAATTAAEEPADGEETPAEEAPAEEAPAEGETPADESAGRNPAGSDLWLDSFTEKDALIADNMQLPDGMSVLIAHDGTQDAPDSVVVSWPLDTSTPWAGPLMAAGAAALLAGLVMYVLGIRHQRRGRGPRRKGPGPMPATEPIELAALPPAEREAIEAPADAPKQSDANEPVQDGKEPEARKSMSATRSTRRRRMLALPALGLTALLAAGCSADSWPQFGAGSPTPSPTPTVIAPENQKPPAVTEAQAARILQQISSTLVEADTALDLELAKTRLDGAALAARGTEYALRTAIPETPVPAAIPTEDIEVVLPEATDRWPRTVLLLSKSTADETVPPAILTMTQQDPWSNYKVTNIAEMQASSKVPDLAAPWLGTSIVPTDSAFLSMAPGELAAAFADVVDTGEQSASYGLFDELSLNLATSIRDSRQAVVQTLADNGAADTSQTAFDIVPSDSAPVSMTTLDSGAIVAISLIDKETVTPTSGDAVIRFGDNAQAKALTGANESAKGVETTYEFQLFFAVPAQSSTEQIRLLAARQDLLSVQVIK